MTDNLQRYEVFIKSVAGFINNDLTSTIWSWRRLNAGGGVLVDGSSHTSLEACFASVKRHAERFGAAPVKINLREPGEAASPAVPPLPVALRNGMVADRESTPHEGLWTRALAPGAIAALSPPDMSYAP